MTTSISTKLSHVIVTLEQRNEREYIVTVSTRYSRDELHSQSFYTLKDALVYFNVAQKHYKAQRVNADAERISEERIERELSADEERSERLAFETALYEEQCFLSDMFK